VSSVNHEISTKPAVTVSALKMIQVEKFLCCLQLEIGGFIIGWSGLVLSIFMVLGEIFLIVFGTFFDCGAGCDENRVGENFF
jgi:hypothetical protein